MYLKILTVPLANVFHVPVLSTELASVNATVKKMDKGAIHRTYFCWVEYVEEDNI